MRPFRSQLLSMSVGARVRALRRSRGVSQLRLALAAGISSRHLSFVECGRSTPGREVLVRLGAALELNQPELNELLLAAGHAPLTPGSEGTDPARFNHLQLPQMMPLSSLASRGSLVLALAAPMPLAAQAGASVTPELEAFRTRRDYFIRGDGTWWAPNPAWTPGADSVASHYGYQFEAGYGPLTYRLKIVGRAGSKTYLFWEGFIAWHPVRNAFQYQSQGTSGAVASGWSINREGDLAFEVVSPDGSTVTQLDRQLIVGDDELRSESFRWKDGKWESHQRLTWRRGRDPAP